MQEQFTAPTQQRLSDDLTHAYEQALLAGTSASTRRAYRRDVDYFWAWANLAQGLKIHYPVSVDTLLRFLLDHAGQMDSVLDTQLVETGFKAQPGPPRIRTLRRYLSSLAVAHTEQGVTTPTRDPRVKLLLRLLQHARASDTRRKKAAITADVLRTLLATCDDSLIGLRDRALLLVSFASGGRRRAELARLQREDLRRTDGGYVIRLRASKTDQQGTGLDVPILGQTAQALSAWLMRSGIRDGHLFRGIRPNSTLNTAISGRTINRLIKKRVAQAGLNPAIYGAHSLRSGFITESGRKGAQLGDAMILSGHRTLDVAQGYYREGELLQDPTAHLLD